MTLSKHRPLRTYDEQWIVENNDLHGLRKALSTTIADHGEDGLADTPYYVGAKLMLDVLFGDETVDNYLDAMSAFERGLEELGGEQWE